MDRARFERIWEKETKQSPDYFVVELKNGTLINTDKYEIISSYDMMLWWKDYYIAFVRIRTIKSIEGKVWTYGKTDNESRSGEI